MIEACLYGLSTGVVLSLMLGTVFFFLIQNSVINGYKTCLWISAGVITSDIILISLCYVNSSILPKGNTTEMCVRLAGAIVLLIMGFTNFFRKNVADYPEVKKPKSILLALNGFSLNIFNPGNFISWLSISAYLTNVNHYTIHQSIAYYIGALATIFLTEVIIAFSAGFLKKFISNIFLYWLNLALGVIFIAFAIVLLREVLIKLL